MNTRKKEPWSILEFRGLANIYDAEGWLVISAIPFISARRIVAAVNACAGIQTETLEQRGMIPITALEQQRDELLTALEAFMALDEWFTTADADLVEDLAVNGDRVAQAVILARNAITRAKALA